MKMVKRYKRKFIKEQNLNKQTYNNIRKIKIKATVTYPFLFTMLAQTNTYMLKPSASKDVNYYSTPER